MKSLEQIADDEMERIINLSNTINVAINRLSKLPQLEYESVRQDEAKILNIRVGALDKAVNEYRSAASNTEKGMIFREVEIWREEVDPEALLDEMVDVVHKFIICNRETAIATALWCAFTWFIDVVNVAPIAIITAPEKRCGKSQLLNLIHRLSRRPVVASSISPSAIYRIIEKYNPTLLIDEADAFMRDNEELRGVINSGHTRQSAYVIRCVGDDHNPMQFSTWGAKALSGIGHLPETIKDRGVILQLRRKLANESVERLRHADCGLFERLSSQLARFAFDAAQIIERSRPSLPSELNDRSQDNWEPLLAIADYAGSRWGISARDAALKLSGSEHEEMSQSAELLSDIREAFEIRRVDRVTTAELLENLIGDDLKPWATYNRGKAITPRQLAKRLDEYGIESRTIRISYGTAKGFLLSQFEDAFARYLSAPVSSKSVTAAQYRENTTPVVTCDSFCAVTDINSVTAKMPVNGLCDLVTDKLNTVTVTL